MIPAILSILPVIQEIGDELMEDDTQYTQETLVASNNELKTEEENELSPLMEKSDTICNKDQDDCLNPTERPVKSYTKMESMDPNPKRDSVNDSVIIEEKTEIDFKLLSDKSECDEDANTENMEKQQQIVDKISYEDTAMKNVESLSSASDNFIHFSTEKTQPFVDKYTKEKLNVESNVLTTELEESKVPGSIKETQLFVDNYTKENLTVESNVLTSESEESKVPDDNYSQHVYIEKKGVACLSTEQGNIHDEECELKSECDQKTQIYSPVVYMSDSDTAVVEKILVPENINSIAINQGKIEYESNNINDKEIQSDTIYSDELVNEYSEASYKIDNPSIKESTDLSSQATVEVHKTSDTVENKISESHLEENQVTNVKIMDEKEQIHITENIISHKDEADPTISTSFESFCEENVTQAEVHQEDCEEVPIKEEKVNITEKNVYHETDVLSKQSDEEELNFMKSDTVIETINNGEDVIDIIPVLQEDLSNISLVEMEPKIIVADSSIRTMALFNSDGRLRKSELSSVLCREDIRDLPICVVAIAGEHNPGNSSLFNYMLRYLSSYGTQNFSPLLNNDSSGRSRCSEPFVITRNNQNGDKEKVVVVIMEWQRMLLSNDEEEDSDPAPEDLAVMLSLAALVSSVLVVNMQGNLNEDTLQHLMPFTSYAKLIDEAEIMDDSVCTPFQNLVFLIHNWQYPDVMSYGYEGGHLMKKEKLSIKKNLPKNSRDLRRYLKDAFNHTSCHLLPSPGDAVTIVDNEFQSYLEELSEELLSPDHLILKTVAGHTITAQGFALLLDVSVACLKDIKELSPSTILESQMQANCTIVSQESLGKYREFMEAALMSCPTFMTEDKLEEENDLGTQEAMKHFREKASFTKGNDQELIQEHERSLSKDMSEVFKEFEAQNSVREDDEHLAAREDCFSHYCHTMEELICSRNVAFLSQHRLQQIQEAAMKEALNRYQSRISADDQRKQKAEMLLNEFKKKIATTSVQFKEENALKQQVCLAVAKRETVEQYSRGMNKVLSSTEPTVEGTLQDFHNTTKMVAMQAFREKIQLTYASVVDTSEQASQYWDEKEMEKELESRLSQYSVENLMRLNLTLSGAVFEAVEHYGQDMKIVFLTADPLPSEELHNMHIAARKNAMKSFHEKLPFDIDDCEEAKQHRTELGKEIDSLFSQLQERNNLKQKLAVTRAKREAIECYHKDMNITCSDNDPLTVGRLDEIHHSAKIRAMSLFQERILHEAGSSETTIQARVEFYNTYGETTEQDLDVRISQYEEENELKNKLSISRAKREVTAQYHEDINCILNKPGEMDLQALKDHHEIALTAALGNFQGKVVADYDAVDGSGYTSKSTYEIELENEINESFIELVSLEEFKKAEKERKTTEDLAIRRSVEVREQMKMNKQLEKDRDEKIRANIAKLVADKEHLEALIYEEKRKLTKENLEEDNELEANDSGNSSEDEPDDDVQEEKDLQLVIAVRRGPTSTMRFSKHLLVSELRTQLCRTMGIHPDAPLLHKTKVLKAQVRLIDLQLEDGDTITVLPAQIKSGDGCVIS